MFKYTFKMTLESRGQIMDRGNSVLVLEKRGCSSVVEQMPLVALL